MNQLLVSISNFQGRFLGTGFFISSDGLILTCDHVISGSYPLKIRTPNDTIVNVTQESIFSDKDRDIALLKLNTLTSELGGKSGKLSEVIESGDQVTALGFQFTEQGVIDGLPVRGVISGKTKVAYKNYLITVLAVQGGPIAGGISGGPLLADDDYVVGMVNSSFNNFGGFAIPISEMLTNIDTRISSSIQSNIERVPSFGKRLNQSGYFAIINQITQSTLDKLKSQEKYLPDMTCRRENVEKAINDFFDMKERRVLGLIGGSGVGKSVALADMASKSRGILLVSGFEFRIIDNSLSISIDHHIEKLIDVNSIPQTTLKQLEKFAKENALELTIAIDAVNEITAPANETDLFLFSAFHLLEKSEVLKLLFTCRTEFWSLCVQANSLLLKKLPTWTIQNISDFTESELNEAIRLYGLDKVTLNERFSHPFLLRLVWEIVRSHPATDIHLDEIFDLYVKKRSAEIAQSMGHHTSKRVTLDLISIGGVLADAASYDISLPALANLGVSEVVDVGVDSGLLISSGESYRFAFDEIAEYFVYKARVELIKNGGEEIVRLWKQGSRIVRESYRYLFTQENDSRKYLATLNSLVDSTDAGENYAFYLLVTFISSFNDTNRFVAILTKIFDKQADSFDRVLYLMSQSEVGNAIFINSKISVQARIRFLRPSIMNLDYYPWRWKDWDELPLEVFEPQLRLYPAGFFLSEIIIAEPIPSFQELSEMIEDETPLKGNEGMAGDFYCAFIFHYRSLFSKELFQCIFDNLNPYGYFGNVSHLCSLIGDRDPHFFLLRVSKMDDEEIDSHVGSYIAILGRLELSPEERTTILAPLLERLKNEILSDEQYATVLNMYAMIPSKKEFAFREKVRRLRIPGSIVSLDEFYPFFDEHFEEIVKLFSDSLLEDNKDFSGSEFTQLGRVCAKSVEWSIMVLQLFESAFSSPKIHKYYLARGLEEFIRECTEATANLFDPFIRKFIERTSSDDVSALKYACTAKNPSLPKDCRIAWIKALLDNHRDETADALAKGIPLLHRDQIDQSTLEVVFNAYFTVLNKESNFEIYLSGEGELEENETRYFNFRMNEHKEFQRWCIEKGFLRSPSEG
jgi:hypothetical protein